MATEYDLAARATKESASSHDHTEGDDDDEPSASSTPPPPPPLSDFLPALVDVPTTDDGGSASSSAAHVLDPTLAARGLIVRENMCANDNSRANAYAQARIILANEWDTIRLMTAPPSCVTEVMELVKLVKKEAPGKKEFNLQVHPYKSIAAYGFKSNLEPTAVPPCPRRVRCRAKPSAGRCRPL